MNLFLLLSAAVFFPSVTEIWHQGPLTAEKCRLPVAEISASENQLNAQAGLFRQLHSPSMRSQMAVEFGQSGNPAAFRLLITLLRQEKNSLVRDNLFNALYLMKQKGQAADAKMNGEFLTESFHAASPVARGTAMFLYLTHTENPDPAKVLTALEKETSLLVLNRVLPPLRTLAPKLSKSLTGNLYTKAADENTALRAMAAELIALQPDPDESALLRKAAADSHPVIRMHIARGLSANRTAAASLLKITAADSHPGVRLASAGIRKPSPAQEEILRKLLSDPSPSVRAAAAESLGTADTVSAAEALAEKLPDPEMAVRRSVADALSRLMPSESIHRKVVELAERNPIARRQALDFLVRTNDQNQSAAILRWIDQSKDPLFLREAATALGKLHCTDGGSTLLRLANSRDDAVRRGAAESMGQLKLPVTYPALLRLCRDREIEVAEAAFLSMYKIGDSSFVPEFERMIGRLTDNGATCRAIACRALCLFKLNEKNIGNLTALVTRACIRVPMAGNMPDVPYSRISALLLLLEHARKGNPAARAAYRQCITLLEQEKTPSELLNEEFVEYLRQVKEYEAGRPVKAKLIDPVKPDFSVKPAELEK